MRSFSAALQQYADEVAAKHEPKINTLRRDEDRLVKECQALSVQINAVPDSVEGQLLNQKLHRAQMHLAVVRREIQDCLALTLTR